MQFRRTGPTGGEYTAEYDLLRRKAESKIEMGAGFQEHFVSILCMQKAWLSRQEKSLALASNQNSLKFADAAASMRRLFGSCGGAGRQGILVTEDADGPSGGGRDQEACVTYKKREGPKKEGRRPRRQRGQT